MRIVIAPDKFKDCLTAAAVAGAIAEGVRQVDDSIEVDLCPMADGGEGTVDALVSATGGRLVKRPVTGPLPGMRVEARFGILGDGETAVIEMAEASGLHLLQPNQRNPLRTTTYGTGELMRAAVGWGARRIVLGIGGSATVDGGVGAIQGWGGTIKLENGMTYGPTDRKLVGSDVAHVLDVKCPISRRSDGKPNVEFLVACDVGNPLHGPDGAAVVFGPQKGASEEAVTQLDSALQMLAQRTGKNDVAAAPGAGAAGGLGFGMMAFMGAELRGGFSVVADALRLEERLAGADLVITGEGKLDAQTASGKTVAGVAGLCARQDVPCLAIAGTIAPGVEPLLEAGLTAWISVCDRPMELAEALENAFDLLRNAAGNAMRLFCAGRGKGRMKAEG